MRDYEALKTLLEKETYPHPFTFKFIGKKSILFEAGMKKVCGQFPELRLKGQLVSQNKNHVSYTYILQAKTAQEIIQVYQAIEGLPDLALML